MHANWLNDPELLKLQHSKTPATLKTLKERYLALLFDLPEEERKQIESAATQEKLQAVMGWIMHEGTRVRFRVKTTFEGHKDDDDDDKDKPKTASEFIDAVSYTHLSLLQCGRVIAGGDSGQVSLCGMACRALTFAVEIGFARLRIARKNVENGIKRAAAQRVAHALMQEVRKI